MAKQYFNIPLASHPALVEMQNLLRRRLPEGTLYNDPATFHMTLVYLEDDKGVEMSFEDVANDLPMFGVGGDYITALETPTGAAVVVAMDRSPQLNYLQSAIYYRAAAAGAKISEHCYPHRWRAHITLATIALNEDQEAPRDTNSYFNSALHLETRSFVLTGDGSYEPLKTWNLRTDMPVQEFLDRITANVQTTNELLTLHEQTEVSEGRTRIELTAVSEMKGAYPNVKLPEDVKVEEIQQKGFKFVTLPIGQVDSKSRNGRNYKKAAIEQLVVQINQKRPEGGWGHIKDEDMGTSYGPPAIRWLAAMIDKNGTAWGKGLPLTQEAQEYFDLARLTNSRVGTSLHAWVTMEGDDVTELDLIKLDLADPARVGVPMTAAKPELSTEMHNDPTPAQESGTGAASVPAAASSEGEAVPSPANPIVQTEQESETVTDTNTTRVTELELAQRESKKEIETLEKQVKELSAFKEDATEIRKILALAPETDLVRGFRHMKEQFDIMTAENSSLLMKAAKAIVVEKVAVKSAHKVVLELVESRKPVTEKQLENAFEDVLNLESIKELLKAKVVEEMGAAQPAPVSTTPGAAPKSFLKPKPEMA